MSSRKKILDDLVFFFIIQFLNVQITVPPVLNLLLFRGTNLKESMMTSAQLTWIGIWWKRFFKMHCMQQHLPYCCIVSWCPCDWFLHSLEDLSYRCSCVVGGDPKKVVCSQGPKGWQGSNIDSLNLYPHEWFKIVPKKLCTPVYSSSVKLCMYPGQACDNLFSASGSPKCFTHTVPLLFAS